ncbi:hypothetical protein EDB85DRAFT_2153370 [Lactarius pseudohatsudake]|nr:hypothetical protein EDB85DRAFT_2153370 [Lactarius pseudohatsudake]
MSAYQHPASKPTSDPTSGGSSIKDIVGPPSSKEQLIKHVDLWFSDGSVVLQAESTLFRVHKSQLARRSVVFSDMFTLPQPVVTTSHATFAEESHEGCPVVRLHDSERDVANLLLALYDGPTFGDNDPDDFAIVSGILRLSTKYAMDSLRSKAIVHLNIAWPTSLKGWDLREDKAHACDLASSTEHASLYPSPIDIINLARETNVPSLLPAAFYDISRYTFSQIFEPMDDELSRFRGAAAGGTLSSEDMRRLALGKEASAHAVGAVIHWYGARASRALTQRRVLVPSTYVGPSHGGRVFHTGGVSTRFCRIGRARNATLCLRPRTRELGALKSADVSECRACARALEVWAAKERERMWKMIPLWFRLDS